DFLNYPLFFVDFLIKILHKLANIIVGNIFASSIRMRRSNLGHIDAAVGKRLEVGNMSVSRNTSRCVIAASILMLSSTTFISSALAQSAAAGQGGQGGISQSGMSGANGGNATFTGSNIAGAP